MSTKFFHALTGLAFLLIAITIAINPVSYLVNLSWLLSLGLFVSAISFFVNYLARPKELRHPIYLLDIVVNLVFAFYLLTRGFAVLPFVVPTIIGIWLIFHAISLLIKARHLSLILPFVGSNVSWVAVLGLLVGLVLIFNPIGTGVFIMLNSFSYGKVVVAHRIFLCSGQCGYLQFTRG